MNVREIEISKIKIVENVRVKVEKLEGLMQDIKQHGLKQAIGVASTKAGEFVLTFGNRRLEACKKLGWKKISANIYPDMEIAELLVNNMAENLHREEITPSELGRICERLKAMDLNPSEISAKLSISKHRVEEALRAYHGLPEKHRNRVAYMGKGSPRAGNIPSSVAMKIIATKKTFGLSDTAIDKLLDLARKEEYGVVEIYIISMFLEQGMTVAQAIDNSKDYKYLRADLVVNNKEVDELLKKYHMDSRPALIQAILYGELPPLKRPSFFKVKQVPVLKG